MINGVIFDLDDTLISEHDYVKSGFKAVAKHLVANNLVKQAPNDVYEMLIQLFNVDSKQVFNRCLANFGVKETPEIIRELIEVYRTHLPEIELLTDAKSILAVLKAKQVPLAMITDGYQMTQRQKLKALNIESDFNCIVVTDELGREYWKPHAKPYEIVQKTLQIPFNELVYIGDNIKKDFITAKKLGMKTIQICRPNGVYTNIEIPKEYQADYQIQSLEELESII